MMRCDVNRAKVSFSCKLLDRVDSRALVIERDGDNPGAETAKDFDRRPIRQFFYGHDVAGTQQRTCEERHRHLASARDADVIRRCRDPARRRKHRRHGFAETLVALRPAVSEKCVAGVMQGASISAADQVARNQPHVGAIRREQQASSRHVVRHLARWRGGDFERNVSR